jgi:hypothetical protein
MCANPYRHSSLGVLKAVDPTIAKSEQESLAKIILELASNDIRNQTTLRHHALEKFEDAELPVPFIRRRRLEV